MRMTPAGLALAGYEGYLALARSRLDEERFAAAWEEGKAMTTELAIDYALSERDIVLATAHQRQRTTSERASKLTPREQEIAALIARGLTNRQIAEELFISERTVDAHVRKILKKLRLHSRTQIVSPAAEGQQRVPPDLG